MKKLRTPVLVVVLALLGAWGWASLDRCGAWPRKAPAITQLAQGRGDLKAGAARVEFALTFPTTAGGYPPPRATVGKALTPLAARALVLEIGGQRLALVLLDVLLVPPQLRDAIGREQGLPIWVLATHTHSGPSGFDPRLAAELAALGTFSAADEAVVVTAAREALSRAQAQLVAARLEVGEQPLDGLNVARSGDSVDRRLTRLRFDGADGPVAQLVVFSAHPTLVARRPEGLHADWPGVLAERLERDHGPVTLVVQGAGGNASVERSTADTPEALAEKLEQAVKAVPTKAEADPFPAAWCEVQVSLSRPDARHLAPAPLRPAVENALCDEVEDFAVLHGLRLGDLRLLFVPVEPSHAAGLVLEEQARATRVVSLADGYAGYVEPVEVARQGAGEAARQYFPPEFLTQLAEGAALVGRALDGPPGS
ncbi:MAG: neutral/alkaline non-lysosomal ceramidase N-terminal domain-containing protein [Myxococcota bacterium]